MDDQRMFFYALGFSIIILTIFYLSYSKDKTRLINGVIFNVFLISTFGSLSIAALTYNNPILRIVFAIIAIILIIVLSLGAILLIIGCLANARIVLKKERKSISNMLTLFIGIGLLVVYLVSIFRLGELHPAVKYLFNYINIIIFYFLLSFYNYFITSILYGIYRPKLNKDFIVVLGSGLIDGDKVSKLLSGRIDKAISFYNSQKETGKESKIIFSGGQGSDEKISEALAMKNYAVEKGVNEEDAILEDKSKNTLENFRYSKEIMENSKIENYDAIFSTSNYHVFRSEIYAKKEGLNISGIGSKTAFYYLANATIREYIAIVLMKKKSYIFKISLITLMYIGYVIISNIK